MSRDLETLAGFAALVIVVVLGFVTGVIPAGISVVATLFGSIRGFA